MIKAFFLSLLILSPYALAGLPPTTSQVSGDSANITTVNFQFPNFTGTHTGTTVSLGVNSVAGGGTGAASLAAGSALVGNGTSAVSLIAHGSSGNVLTSNGSTWTSAAPATNGTVTSAAMTVPGFLSISGSPITTSGTFAVTLATESANTVMAGPTTGAAATPTYRSLVVADQTIASQAISASAIDWSTGNLFTKTLGASTTFTFSNQLSGQTIVVRLTNTASNWTVTWPAVKWPNGAAPTMSTGAVSDVYTFVYDGTNTYGTVVQALQ